MAVTTMTKATFAAAACFALLAVCSAARRESILTRHQDMPVQDAAFVDAVNAKASTWKAAKNDKFDGMSIADAKRYCGTILEDPAKSGVPKRTIGGIADAAIPDTFNAVTQWPGKIHPIRNQGQCGSCWAFAASESLSDRFAIASNGSVDVVLSPQDLVNCDDGAMGCHGGMISQVWQYMAETGILSDKCDPYTSGQTQDAGTCLASTNQCVKPSDKFQHYKAKDVHYLSTVEDMQKAIMTEGPIEVGFLVYKSFMSYKSGVYQREWYDFWDPPMGGHAVKAVGWGTEDGTDYWLIANSWGTSWGEDGFFKIKRGVDECGIEKQAYAGSALL